MDKENLEKNAKIKERLLNCVQIIEVSGAEVCEAGKKIDIKDQWGKMDWFKNVSSGEIFWKTKNRTNLVICYEKFDKWLILDSEMTEKMITAIEMQSAQMEQSFNQKIKMKI